MPARSV